MKIYFVVKFENLVNYDKSKTDCDPNEINISLRTL